MRIGASGSVGLQEGVVVVRDPADDNGPQSRPQGQQGA